MASRLNGNDFTIFVGGLANNVTDGNLFNYFAAFGNILTCKAQMWHNNPQKCRGFALVTAGDKETYDIILSSQHEIAGRNIECKVHIKDKSQLNDYSKSESDRKIFVSGLPKRVTDEELKSYFSYFGPVKIAYIVKHHKDKKPKGFGFVIFENKADRDVALQYGDHYFYDKKTSCTEYSTKADLKKRDNNSQELSNQEVSEDDSNYQSTTGNSDSDLIAGHNYGAESQYQARFNATCGQFSEYQPTEYDQGFDAYQPSYQAHATHIGAGAESTWSTAAAARCKQTYSPFKGSNLLAMKINYVFGHY